MLYVQLELHVVLSGQKLHRPGLVALVDMDVAEVYRDGLERKVYLSGHEIQMVDVGRKSEVGVGTALVGRNHEPAVVDLELHQAEARRLIALGVCGSEEQHVVLAVSLLPVDPGDQCRQLL